MRSKTQFTCSLKVAILSIAFLCLFILLFRSSIFSLSPQLIPQTNLSNSNAVAVEESHHPTTETPETTETAATPSSCPPIPLNPTCNKAPPSLSNALIHYVTTNITPQQTLREISVSARVLQKKSPCNFLVFGLGHDSLMWTSLNYGGRTVFLEEDKSWIDQIQQKIPSLESYHVMYDTQVHQAEELLKVGMEADCKKVSDPRFSQCQLAHKGFPSEVYDIDWDVIMVDAPTGYFEGAPGRMTAIYTAGLIARNKGHGETDVFVHDVDRDVEDKFSKAFLCEGYLKEQELIPYWYPQMDVDIRKPVTHKFGIERPGASNDISTSGNLDDDDSEDEDAVMGLPAANGNEDDDRMRRLRDARDVMEQNEMERTRDYGTLTNGNDPNALDIEERVAAGRTRDEDYPIYDSDSDDDDEEFEAAKRQGGLRYAKKWVERTAANVGSTVLSSVAAIIPKPTPTDVGEGGFSLGVPSWKQKGEVKRFKAPKGKRIHVPVRVEPKVQLATERTFLSWLEFSILIGSIAATLLNFGDSLAFAAAWAFTIIACLALCYSAGLYLWRVNKIKERRAVTYHDRWGPTLLCLGLFCAVAVSFGYRFGKGGVEGGLKGDIKG